VHTEFELPDLLMITGNHEFSFRNVTLSVSSSLRSARIAFGPTLFSGVFVGLLNHCWQANSATGFYDHDQHERHEIILFCVFFFLSFALILL
jgi:hypothetical protein